MAKKRYFHQGSAVLAMLIIMTGLVIIMHSALRASMYQLLLAQERHTFINNR